MLLKFLSSFTLLSVISALGQKQSISFAQSHGALQLFGGHGPSTTQQILVSANDYWGVQKAAGDLATDFGRVTGKNLSLTADGATSAQPIYTWRAPTSDVNYTLGPEQQILGPLYTNATDHKQAVIIVGTIGRSEIIDKLVKAKKIDVTKVKGKWESFVSQIVRNPIPGVDKALVVAGSDLRGSIFGVSYPHPKPYRTDKSRYMTSPSKSESHHSGSGQILQPKSILRFMPSTSSKFKDHQPSSIVVYSSTMNSLA